MRGGRKEDWSLEEKTLGEGWRRVWGEGQRVKKQRKRLFSFLFPGRKRSEGRGRTAQQEDRMDDLTFAALSVHPPPPLLPFPQTPLFLCGLWWTGPNRARGGTHEALLVPLSICFFLCSVGHGHASQQNNKKKGLSSKSLLFSTLPSVPKSHTDT